MKIFGMYLLFQIVMAFFGPVTALLAPVFFLWVYFRAKRECGQ